jgi:hypothetical protein
MVCFLLYLIYVYILNFMAVMNLKKLIEKNDGNTFEMDLKVNVE